MSRLSWFFRGKSKSGRKASPQPIILRVEHLEDRLAPIVGAFAVPAAIAPLAPPQPPSPYDGVVLLKTVAGTEGSGSLIYTGTGWGFGHQILTVAHHIAKGPLADKDAGGNPVGSAIAVRFDLTRGDNPVPIPINVPKNIDGGAQYQIQHSAFGDFKNDIGLLVLTDQQPGMSAPDRLLVAPFKAQQYTLYNGTPAEVGQQFTMVGYGDTGTGANGANQVSSLKRVGQNRFDAPASAWNPAETMNLLYDFDRAAGGGLNAIDPLGQLGIAINAGLGAAEALMAPGDSGGPAFVGANVIAGVLSSVDTPGMPPDINAVKTFSFGELGFITNVSMTIGNAALQGVLNPGGAAGYHLVLDMEQQVYGRSNVAGQPNLPDQLVIHAKNVGGFLELHVNNTDPATADPALNNRYYRAPAANIKSLTIRGTSDNEYILIEGPLGLKDNGPVYIQGREGNDSIEIRNLDGPTPDQFFGEVFVDGGAGDDTVWVNNSQSTNVEGQYTLVDSTNPTYTTELFRATKVAVGGAFLGRPSTFMTGLERFKLWTANGKDTVTIGATAANSVENGLYTYDGDDVVKIGAENVGMANIRGPVFVDSGNGTQDEITLQDAISPALGVTYKIVKSVNDPIYNLFREVGNPPQQAGSPVSFASVEQVALHTGTKGDTVHIEATPASADKKTFVYGHEENDHITIGVNGKGLDDILSVVDVTGQAGDDTLVIDNRGAMNKQLTVTKTAVTRGDGKTVNYLDVKTLEVKTDGGAGNVNIQEKAAGVEVKISLQDAGNTVAIGSGVFGFELGGAPNAITVTGAGNQITLASTLEVSVVPTFAAPAGTVFAIIDNQAAAIISGTFNGLPEGTEFTAGARRFRISYTGLLPSDPYPDVTLTVVSTPFGVSGTAWSDTNGNGRQDASELGAAGVTVFLLDVGGNVLASVVTDASGNYSFTNLVAGTYRLRFAPPSQYP
ncbi:MAG: carboxypeptidase regulatory-like domain-containing protein, partial [Planctomycetia bacterium]|nr:carboxypeptidase regulatory-like domain-containing protein [Planctomycetia bacterium]